MSLEMYADSKYAGLRLLDNLPHVSKAKLPERYKAAKEALAECDCIDECKACAAKMEALACDARQADDTVLEDLVMRIRIRAVQRYSELLKEVPSHQRKRTDQKFHAHAGTESSPREHAPKDAGLFEREAKTAICT